MQNTTRYLKLSIAFLAVLLVRLMPLRAPNVEPILATVMPLSKRYGALQSLAFAILSIVVYDFFTAGIGSWTIAPALCYGVLAAASALYFRNRTASRVHYVGFSVVGILFYDAVTGVIAGPLFGYGNLSTAIAGQIPFTMLHLLGAVAFAALVSPALARWFAMEGVFAPAPKAMEIL